MICAGACFNYKQGVSCTISLRSKRFQSSYCAKVRAEPKKKVIPFFFALAPAHFLDELARKRLLRRLMHDRFRLSPKRGNKIEGVVLNRIK